MEPEEKEVDSDTEHSYPFDKEERKYFNEDEFEDND